MAVHAISCKLYDNVHSDMRHTKPHVILERHPECTLYYIIVTIRSSLHILFIESCCIDNLSSDVYTLGDTEMFYYLTTTVHYCLMTFMKERFE